MTPTLIWSALMTKPVDLATTPRKALSLLLLTCLLGLLAGVAAPPAQASRAHPRVEQRDAALQRAVDAIVAAGASGAVVLVDDGTDAWQQASGAARLEPEQAWRRDEKVRIGSITKTFVATLVLQLVDEGRLSLEDDVEEWVPGLVPGGVGISLRHLLQHTSGLFSYSEDEAFLDAFVTDPERSFTPGELVAYAVAHPPLFAPGADWSYSNTNYVLLGLVLENATGESLRSLLRDRIIKPLGLTHTKFPAGATIPGKHAAGYLPPSLTGLTELLDVTGVNPSWAGAAGALLSTTTDVRDFYRALLSGELLSPASLAAMKQTVPIEEGTAYGLGLLSIETPCGTVWGHDGSVTGYSTYALSNESGTRSMVLALPTTPDEAISAAQLRALSIAVCAMYGRSAPARTLVAGGAGG
ncbi:serine hydrolase domain-containing protein [Motilibacter aurantiacus]|uniref:serine hydrolase domain-containing protein n=1 Tax=Motilibacter aurantiacus TaxID=2714955 RepID=UPI00140A3140|nr:serine hydrolase domain-containing protein [Motilibacter aurantiacus]NHC43977.1 beta-lactamase family protein [Motilibacter aurantiacus]